MSKTRMAMAMALAMPLAMMAPNLSRSMPKLPHLVMNRAERRSLRRKPQFPQY